MAEHGLQAAQIGAAFQKVGGKAMPQHVRCQILPQSNVFPIIFQQLPERLPRHRAASIGQEQIPRVPTRRLLPTTLDIGLNGLHGGTAERDQPLLPPFADHPNDADIQIHRPISTVHSSVTRSPVAYSNWSIARSRSPFGLVSSGASRRASTCSNDKYLGRVFHCRGRTSVPSDRRDACLREKKPIEVPKGRNVSRDTAAGQRGRHEGNLHRRASGRRLCGSWPAKSLKIGANPDGTPRSSSV